jgi:hypothetical protein
MEMYAEDLGDRVERDRPVIPASIYLIPQVGNYAQTNVPNEATLVIKQKPYHTINNVIELISGKSDKDVQAEIADKIMPLHADYKIELKNMVKEMMGSPFLCKRMGIGGGGPMVNKVAYSEIGGVGEGLMASAFHYLCKHLGIRADITLAKDESPAGEAYYNRLVLACYYIDQITKQNDSRYKGESVETVCGPKTIQ